MKLKIGDTAPDFSLLDQQGKKHSLTDYNEKWLVLYFYPKDLTPGCTDQACDIRDNYSLLTEKGISILGISADDEKMHQKFATKHHLNFPLLSDTEKVMILAYGVWGSKQFMGKKFDGILRTTFIIDEKGKIAHIIDKVKTKEHVAQILEAIN